MTETELAFQAQIYNYVEEAPNNVTYPDKSNKGRLLAMLMLWKRINQLSDKKYDTLLAQLIEEEVIRDPKTINTPGVHLIGEANKLTVEVNVSKYRREFNMDWFAKQLKLKHKVPEAVTRELFEKAKQEGTSQTRTITVKEKGINI
jgi:hypothetical protein